MSTDAGTPTPRTELLLDNAATAGQEPSLLRNADGTETVLREAVRLNVVEPLERDLTALRAAHEAAQAALKLAEEQDRNESLDSICRFLDNEATLTWREVLAKYDRAEAAQAEIVALRVNDARYKARRAAIFQMRLRTEIPGYRNWKPTTVEEFNAEYDAACDKEVLKLDAARKAK